MGQPTDKGQKKMGPPTAFDVMLIDEHEEEYIKQLEYEYAEAIFSRREDALETAYRTRAAERKAGLLTTLLDALKAAGATEREVHRVRLAWLTQNPIWMVPSKPK